MSYGDSKSSDTFNVLLLYLNALSQFSSLRIKCLDYCIKTDNSILEVCFLTKFKTDFILSESSFKISLIAIKQAKIIMDLRLTFVIFCLNS